MLVLETACICLHHTGSHLRGGMAAVVNSVQVRVKTSKRCTSPTSQLLKPPMTYKDSPVDDATKPAPPLGCIRV